MFLEVKNLVKKYKDGFCANDDISFSVRGEEVFGILGPSGAGKTTLITCIFREGAKILVRNGQFLFIDMVNRNGNNSIFNASVISDESALESIKVDGEQVFTKDTGTTR